MIVLQCSAIAGGPFYGCGTIRDEQKRGEKATIRRDGRHRRPLYSGPDGPLSGLVGFSGTWYTIQVVAAHGSWITPPFYPVPPEPAQEIATEKSLH